MEEELKELKAKIVHLEGENEIQANYAKVWEKMYLESIEKITALDAKLTAVKAIISIL